MSDVVLWVDTNIVWSPRLASDIAELAKKKGIQLVAHAQVHLEKCRQLREKLEKRGETFSLDIIETSLKQLQITIATATLDKETAERWAGLLHARYPEEKKWKQAKLSTVKATLPKDSSVPFHKVPMTTDWLIALEVEDRDAYVAVDDKQEEWAALRAKVPQRAFTYDEAMKWLASFPDVAA